MTGYELLMLNRGILQTMKEASLDIGDIKYLPMYKEYVRLMKEGHKKTYIVQYLSDEYEISTRNVYRVIDKFSCNIHFNGAD